MVHWLIVSVIITFKSTKSHWYTCSKEDITNSYKLWGGNAVCDNYTNYTRGRYSIHHEEPAIFVTNQEGVIPHAPGYPNSFNFMQYLGKFGKIVCWRLLEHWRPYLSEILDSLVLSLILSDLPLSYTLFKINWIKVHFYHWK